MSLVVRSLVILCVVCLAALGCHSSIDAPVSKFSKVHAGEKMMYRFSRPGHNDTLHTFSIAATSTGKDTLWFVELRSNVEDSRFLLTEGEIVLLKDSTLWSPYSILPLKDNDTIIQAFDTTEFALGGPDSADFMRYKSFSENSHLRVLGEDVPVRKITSIQEYNVIARDGSVRTTQTGLATLYYSFEMGFPIREEANFIAPNSLINYTVTLETRE